MKFRKTNLTNEMLTLKTWMEKTNCR